MAEQTGDGIVRVLGPTSIGDHEPTGKQAVLLATLALREGTTVGADILIDALWEGTPPASARASLQNQVARLRSQHGASIVRTEAAGYRLGWTTDAAQFEAAVASIAHIAPREALIPGLETGLAPWRGTPFSGLDDLEGVMAARARLTELRASVEEQLAASRLAAGIVEPTIPELCALAEREPFRERRWALLMTALHRAGRSTEALATYRRYSAILDTELGVEPSGPMRVLSENLAEDRAIDLDPASADQGISAEPVPRCGRRTHRRRQPCSASQP